MGHPWRFEQLGRTSGTLEIGGESFRIEGSANRIRRQSIRKTSILWGHAWQAAVTGTGDNLRRAALRQLLEKVDHVMAVAIDGPGPARVGALDTIFFRRLIAPTKGARPLTA